MDKVEKQIVVDLLIGAHYTKEYAEESAQAMMDLARAGQIEE